MIILRGKSVYRDICIGRVVFWEGHAKPVLSRGNDPEAQQERYERAVNTAWEQLMELSKESEKNEGVNNAEIFRAQGLILKDERFRKAVQERILSQGMNAEYAVKDAGEALARELEGAHDEYIRERAADILDVAGRILKILTGTGEKVKIPDKPFILAAEDLLPSDAAQLKYPEVLGIALQKGSIHSHTAILAGNKGIPAMVGLGSGLDAGADGKTAVIDGLEGLMYVDPDSETLKRMEEKKKEWERHKERVRNPQGRQKSPAGAKTVRICANVGSVEDVRAARANGAQGVGLLRSEFFYLESACAPDEESQYIFYRNALKEMEGQDVVIRTFDLGGDKQVPWLGLPREENPALGLRGIRLALARPDLLKTQLKALYRAGVDGGLRIMYPMITSVEEIHRLRVLERETKRELARDGIPFAQNVPTGIMIETPAAALLSMELAREADFFSIGTNDLTQYTLASDRQSEIGDELNDTGCRAVFKLIEMTAESAHKAGIKVCICGEMAADTRFTQKFIEIGIDELSVSPGKIPELREAAETIL